MTTREQKLLVKGRSNSENLTFSFAVLTNVKRKRASDDETKHCSPDIQFREFSLTKQKTRPRTEHE